MLRLFLLRCNHDLPIIKVSGYLCEIVVVVTSDKLIFVFLCNPLHWLLYVKYI